MNTAKDQGVHRRRLIAAFAFLIIGVAGSMIGHIDHMSVALRTGAPLAAVVSHISFAVQASVLCFALGVALLFRPFGIQLVAFVLLAAMTSGAGKPSVAPQQNTGARAMVSEDDLFGPPRLAYENSPGDMHARAFVDDMRRGANLLVDGLSKLTGHDHRPAAERFNANTAIGIAPIKFPNYQLTSPARVSGEAVRDITGAVPARPPRNTPFWPVERKFN